LGCPVMILQRDEDALEQAQRAQRHDQDQRRPKQGVQPERRLIRELDDQRRRDDDEAADEDREYGGAVARIGERIIEPANLTARPELQETAEQLAVPAARTTAGKTGQDRKGNRNLAVG